MEALRNPDDCARAERAGDTEGVTAAVLLTGAPGAGKSATLQALAALLTRNGISFGAIEAEQFVRGSPRLTVEQAAEQLAATLELQRGAGRRLFLVAAGVETAAELAEIVAAIGTEQLLVVGLSASAETLTSRLAQREAVQRRGDESITARARALAAIAPRLNGIDCVIETDNATSAEVANEILTTMDGHGLLSG